MSKLAALQIHDGVQAAPVCVSSLSDPKGEPAVGKFFVTEKSKTALEPRQICNFAPLFSLLSPFFSPIFLSCPLFRLRAQPIENRAGSIARDRSSSVTPPSTTTGPEQSRYLPARFKDNDNCRAQRGNDDDDVSKRKM